MTWIPAELKIHVFICPQMSALSRRWNHW